ncbi:NRAMP family divalent metal transporter [Sulfurisphaera ohwakuensis]|uniref:NRAMP family divalent metal transporter n=1 Tax=Sulfurisphaera ohwakuensis TaxID=69656 RepID=UPI0036F3D740
MWRKRITTSEKTINFLKVFGPAWLVMMADMDASSIIGAAQTGAVYNYGFVWILLLLIIPLYIIQETSGRIGVATGKGLGEVIRENYSKRVAAIMALPMAITDAFTYAIEYMGIAIGFEVLGIPLIISIPAIFIIHILIVTKQKYVEAERVLLGISLALIVGLTATLFLRGVKDYSPIYFKPSPLFFFLIAANVGAVIMPFMLYFQASATAIKLKEIDAIEYKSQVIKHMRKETLLGAIATEILMVIVEMTFAGIKNASDPSVFASASQLATVMTPIAGDLSPIFFSIGLISAGFLALVVISLGSAWGVVEALGIPKRSAWKIYVIESIPAVLVTLLLPPSMLINTILDLLVFFVYALIGPIIILGIISRNKKIMGEYYSSGIRLAAYWISAMIILSIAIIATF